MITSFIRLLGFVLLFGFIFSCSKTNAKPDRYTVVKIPPAFNKSISDEENYWQYKKFLFPQVTIPDPIPKGLPNDDSLFIVSIEKNGATKLNSEVHRSIRNTIFLNSRLKDLFLEREKENVFEATSSRVAKAVGLKGDPSIGFGDVFKVLQAVNDSGADPIILLMSNRLPYMKIEDCD